MSDTSQHLQQLFHQLSAEDQATLLSFAEFLVQRNRVIDRELAKPDITLIERPDTETVPEALQRLKAAYSMLDASTLLAEASDLMSDYIIQGRPAPDVIDELENLFKRHYQKYLTGK